MKSLSHQFAFDLVGGTPDQMREAVGTVMKFWADTARQVGYEAP